MEAYVDLSNWERLINQLTPRQLIRFGNGYINRMTFAARNDVVDVEMEKVFTRRSRGLFRKHLMYEKAKNMVGYFGSIKTVRFTAWKEQQYGDAQERHINISTKGARGKTGKGILQTKFRRNKLGQGLIPVFGKLKTEKLRGWAGKNNKDKIYPATFSILKHKGYTGPVYLPEDWTTKSGKKFPAGIYNFLKNKMKIQSYDKPKEPKEINWAKITLTMFLNKWKTQSDSVVESEMNKIFKR